MKQGDIVICKEDWRGYAKIGDIFVLVEDKYHYGYVTLKRKNETIGISIINRTFNKYFITLAEYREQQINSILE